VRALCPWPGKTLPAGASAKPGRKRNVR